MYDLWKVQKGLLVGNCKKGDESGLQTVSGAVYPPVTIPRQAEGFAII